MASPATTRVAATRRGSEHAALLIASFGAFMAFLDATIVNVCFPAIQASFPGSSTSTLAWVLNAYNLVFAAALVAGGRLADLVGRRRVFVGGVVLFTAASALCATAGSVEVLILWRVVQAVGAALLVPASLGLVIQAASAERRAHAVSMWGAAAALAAGLGPPAGGALIAVSGWRLAFLVNLPLGIAAAIAGMRLLPESRSPGRRRMPDLVGVAVLAGSLALLSLAIVQGPTWGWSGVRVIAALVVAVGLLTVVAHRVRSHPVPVVDPVLLRSPTFTVASLATVGAGMGMYAYLLNHILWLSYVWHYSLLRAGLGVAPSALVTAVVASRLGRVAEERGFRLVAVPGALLWAFGLWWFSHRVGVQPHYLTQWLPGALIAGAGCGATLPVLGSAAVAAVPGGRYATASSVISAVRQLGGVLGVSLLVVIVGTPSRLDPLGFVASLREGWRFSGWCFLAVAVVTLAMRPARDVGEDAPALPVPDVRRNDAVTVVPRDPDQTSVLRGLDPEVVAELNSLGHETRVLAGRPLYSEGDPGGAMHVLLSGRLDVVKGGRKINEVGQGAVVGELSVLTGEPRSATVVAARDSVLTEVPAAGVLDVLSRHPAAMATLASRLARRIQELPAPPRPDGAPTVICVVSVAGPRPGEIADRLVHEMSRHVTVVNPGVVTASGLERAETAGDRVVLVAGDEDPDWRHFCLRHADEVVLVGSGTPHLPMPAEGCELVLTGPVDADCLADWLNRTGARRAHLVDTCGLEPLAARLSGRSLGLALAGGGARAMSHVGLLHELEAADVVVHRIAGASVGAYIGAMYAAGWPVHEIEAVMRAEFVDRKPVSDWTFPRYALARGARIRKAAERVFGDLRAEALPRELTVVASDVYRREAVALRSGLLRDITRASASVPGLLPPVRVGDRMLVDGAVTGNLPVQPLADEGVGPVLAVNLAAGGGDGPRARTSLRTPALPETLMRILMMSGADADRRASERADIVVTAQTRDIGLLEFHQIDASIEAGRAAGRAAVAALADLPS